MTEALDSQSVTERQVASHRQFLAFLERRLGDRALAEDISAGCVRQEHRVHLQEVNP